MDASGSFVVEVVKVGADIYGCTLDSALLNDLLESFVTLENTFCFGFSEDFWRTLYGKKLLV